MQHSYHLHEIHHAQDPLLDLVDQDPVRPHIPKHQRVGPHHRVLVLMKEDEPQSVVCVALSDHVGVCEQDLFAPTSAVPQVIMLYTIWSLKPGAGTALVHEVINYVKQYWCTVTRVVTLSPPTQMAEKFHLRNGAHQLQHNGDTVNFEYKII